jgi:hypothetical protein
MLSTSTHAYHVQLLLTIIKTNVLLHAHQDFFHMAIFAML